MITVREGLTGPLRVALVDIRLRMRPELAVYDRSALDRATIQQADGCRFMGLYDGDKPIGYLSYKRAKLDTPEGSVHILIDPAYHGRWMTRGVVMTLLDVIFSDRSVVRVKVRGEKAWRFVERFGLCMIEDHGVTRVYEMGKFDAFPYRSTRRTRFVRTACVAAVL